MNRVLELGYTMESELPQKIQGETRGLAEQIEFPEFV